MSKMQEAFKQWKITTRWDCNDTLEVFEAGYQAAIADVKSGGQIATVQDAGFGLGSFSLL